MIFDPRGTINGHFMYVLIYPDGTFVLNDHHIMATTNNKNGILNGYTCELKENKPLFRAVNTSEL